MLFRLLCWYVVGPTTMIVWVYGAISRVDNLEVMSQLVPTGHDNTFMLTSHP